MIDYPFALVIVIDTCVVNDGKLVCADGLFELIERTICMVIGRGIDLCRSKRVK